MQLCGNVFIFLYTILSNLNLRAQMSSRSQIWESAYQIMKVVIAARFLCLRKASSSNVYKRSESWGESAISFTMRLIDKEKVKVLKNDEVFDLQKKVGYDM